MANCILTKIRHKLAAVQVTDCRPGFFGVLPTPRFFQGVTNTGVFPAANAARKSGFRSAGLAKSKKGNIVCSEKDARVLEFWLL